MKKTILNQLLLVGLLLQSVLLLGQETFPYNGVQDHRDGLYAFTNATIYKTYNQKIENATLVIKDGKVVNVGAGIAVPQDAVVIDATDKVIYPSFIESYSNYGMPEVKKSNRKWTDPPVMLSKKEGAYSWNQALKTELRAHEMFTTDGKSAKELQKLGFGTVVTHQMDGISRGTSTAVTLQNDREHEVIIKEMAAHQMSINKGNSPQGYPSSQMGVISLLKQTYLDGQWYASNGRKEEVNLSLDAWNRAQTLPQVMEINTRLEALRAAKIAKEFGKNYVLVGNGDEYQRINELKATGSSFIIPVNYPAAYDVEDPYDAMNVDLAAMKHWELAPSNLAMLEAAGVNVALTTYRLNKKGEFMKQVRKAVKEGFSKEGALKALTATPAQLMGISAEVGSLETGKLANFIITSGDIFEDGKVLHNWIKGNPNTFGKITEINLDGKYKLQVGTQNYDLEVSGGSSPSMKIVVNDTTSIKIKSSVKDGLVSMNYTPQDAENLVRLTGSIGQNGWMGKGVDAEGEWVAWTVNNVKALAEEDESKEKKEEKATADTKGKITYPFTPFGWESKPQAQTVIIQNATVWTNEADGILREADVLIENGKISKVGKDLSKRGATIVDGTGKHVTAGIIDEHSHIAISRGVNEGTQASSAEVSIADVVDSEDVDIYRQLAGGVTTSQLLHGSANPIGGQSALIKLRWGYAPEEMKFAGADPFIKFALGENVKQTNWGDNNTVRFPQTRMGVEQVFEDYFTRARDYANLKASGKPYRKDIEMETILEILESKRFITCHSYQQGEINMLMKVADRHGFKVNTFTHILEGYKVADKMAEHGAGGSTFSDWWAYKYEVIHAIPQNGKIMHDQGVVVAFNSDDAEMARRLNQEAGKAVMYGNVNEEDALKFVTLNPAKLLHIDDKVGSIKPGKDADIVLWSDHPLSIYAKAEQTYVDGIKFFDRTENEAKQKAIAQERHRLIQKMLAVKNGGGKTQKPNGKHKHHYHCDHVNDEAK